MTEYVVLTNRKRALIALIHSVVFCLIALRSAVLPSSSPGLIAALRAHDGLTGSASLAGVFAVVTAVLLWLFVISKRTREKLYFGLCAVSAGTGFLRTLMGDPAFHSSNYIRVTMLVCAVAVGSVILREHQELEFSRE